MEEFIFGDMFILFKNEFDIEETDIFKTYYEFDKKQELEIGIKLFIKSLNKDKVKNYLLVCIQSVEQVERFAFAYWIPNFLLKEGDSLVKILERLSHEFGCEISIPENLIGYFFRKSQYISADMEIDNPDEIVKNLEPNDIPCKTFFFYERYKQDGRLNFFWIYYCFSINEFKYNAWLHNISMTDMEVPSEWHSLLNGVTKVLNPLGGTEVKILKNEKEVCVHDKNSQSKPSKDCLSISFPKRYKGTFEYSISLLNKLEENEKVVLIPVQKNQGCLFCHSADGMTSEHIFPKWLRNYVKDTVFESSVFLDGFNASENILERITRTLYDNKLAGLEKATAHGFTVKEVCQACNNGWMAQLEEQAKRILTADNRLLLISTLSLDFHDSFSLSLWLCKIWILILHKFPSKQVPEKMFRDLMSGKLPEGLIIELSQAVNEGMNFAVTHGSHAFTPLKPQNMTLEDAQKFADDFVSITLHIGYNLFRMSYLPPGNPLLRKTAVRETKVLYPWNYNLDLVEVDQDLEEKILGGADSSLELALFSVMIVLT